MPRTADDQAPQAAYQRVLSANRYGLITTEIKDAGPFYFAEDYHQQYLAKVPHGYCGLGGTGLSCPIGVGVKALSRLAFATTDSEDSAIAAAAIIGLRVSPRAG